MAKILVIWTSCYDNIMSCWDDLNKNFWGDLDECVKLTYNIDDLKKEIWWTGLNIVYNLSLLWSESVLYSSVGNDFEFSDFLKKNVDLSHVLKSEELLSSRNYITSYKDKNEVSSNFLWATSIWNEVLVNEISDIDYAIISSFEINSMIKNLQFLKKSWIKTIFSPSNQIWKMTKSDLENCFSNTDVLIVNTSDFELIKQKSEKSDWEMISMFENLIITYGINGSKIFDPNYNMIEIPWVSNPEFKDNIWASDAYKAWIVKWLNNWFSIEKSAKIWAVLASVSTWSIWAQNHKTDWKELDGLYRDTYWEEL